MKLKNAHLHPIFAFPVLAWRTRSRTRRKWGTTHPHRGSSPLTRTGFLGQAPAFS